MNKLQRLYVELQRLYEQIAGYGDNKANSAQFQLGLGLSLAIKRKNDVLDQNAGSVVCLPSMAPIDYRCMVGTNC